MSVQEVMFARLLSRYEKAGLGEPPFRAASLDEAVRYMKDRLSQRSRQVADGLQPTAN